MLEFKVIKSGQTSNGIFWAMVQKEVSGFIMTGFVKRATEPFDSDTISLPSVVANAIKWQA